MNKKIFAFLIVLIAVFTVAGVSAQDFVSHDFGQFKMDVPDAQNGEIAEQQGGISVNHTIYAIPNPDGSLFAYLDYLNTTHTNGNNNTSDFALNLIKENNTVSVEEGIPTWIYEGTTDHGYLVSSEDDTQVLIVQSSDVNIKEAINSVEFK